MMYKLFGRNVMDDLFDDMADVLPQIRNYTSKLDEFDLMGDEYEEYFDELRGLGENEVWDELNNPTNTRSIRHPPMPIAIAGVRNNPPNWIEHGEVTTFGNAPIAYAQLVFHHFVGVFNRKGLLHPPVRRGCAGLALIHTHKRPGVMKGTVEYRVFEPDLRSVRWWGYLDRLSPQKMSRGGQGHEDGVRNLLYRLTRQAFRARSASDTGPDLLPLRPGRAHCH
jgi:hypothetical protein